MIAAGAALELVEIMCSWAIEDGEWTTGVSTLGVTTEAWELLTSTAAALVWTCSSTAEVVEWTAAGAGLEEEPTTPCSTTANVV